MPAADVRPPPATVILLGTGTSVGVPTIGCGCAVCTSDDPRNRRTRCSIVVRSDAGRVLVDTPPDLQMQLVRERIPLVNAVVFTHEHADHIFGLDDLRLFPFRLNGPVPLYATDVVEQRIRRSFDYAFHERAETHPGSKPRLEFRRIDRDEPFDVLDQSWMPIPMSHGPHFETLGFRIGDFAYCTDVSHIPDASFDRLAGVRTLVLGALREEPHPTHFNLEQAIEASRRIGARRTLLTHVGHNLDFAAANRRLPDGIDLAFDGMRLRINAAS